MSRVRMVVANWKANGSLAACRAWASEFLALGAPETVELALAAPFVYLPELARALAGSGVAVAAQSLSAWDVGAYTGEVTAGMLADLGVGLSLIGHSERRSLCGESDFVVAAKCCRAVAAGLRPIVCLGESREEREAGRAKEVVRSQLRAVLVALDPSWLLTGALAYEPVWAIGTGLCAEPEDAQDMHAAIRAEVADLCGAELAEGVRLLYGGSLKPDSAAGVFAMPDVDGGLVGGASLRAGEFHAICLAAAGAQATDERIETCNS